MTLKEKIGGDLKEAMKAGDSARRSTLRMLLSSIHNKEIELGKQKEGLTDGEAVVVLSAEAKRRREAAAEYEKAGRTEQVQKEKEEHAVIKEYLPRQMSPEEIRSELRTLIQEHGAAGLQDMGKVMGEAMKKLKGRADGAVVKEELEKLLA